MSNNMPALVPGFSLGMKRGWVQAEIQVTMSQSEEPAGDMVPLIVSDWPQLKVPRSVAVTADLLNPSGGGGVEQMPFAHDPLGHTIPQLPQLFESVETFEV